MKYQIITNAIFIRPNTVHISFHNKTYSFPLFIDC